jgi:hypothetical protein
MELTIMTSIFNRSTNRTAPVQATEELAIGSMRINHAPVEVLDLPIQSIDVRNGKGYKNLQLSVDTLPKSGGRIKIDALDNSGNVTNTVFVSRVALKAFIDALDVLSDYGFND